MAEKSSRRRVFILGAGVSASCGIAVARDILKYAIEDLKTKRSAEAERIHDVLRYLYPGFDEDLGNYPNVEDFLHFIEVAINFNRDFLESTVLSVEKLKKVKQITLKAFTDYIWQLMSDPSRQRFVHDFVTNNLRPGDTVVTFNWDLTIERALENYPGDPGFEYVYSRRRKQPEFSLLKPHGSVDWFETSKLDGLKCERKIEKHDKELCYYPQFHLGEVPDLRRIAPVIVPPLASKRFKFRFLHRTWRGILRAVADATELHVLGYSLPKEDQFAKYVLRRAIRNNMNSSDKKKKRALRLFVVNPDESVEQTFRKLVGRNLKSFAYYPARFEDLAANYQELIYAAD
jgi:hypothetical protein